MVRRNLRSTYRNVIHLKSSGHIEIEDKEIWMEKV